MFLVISSLTRVLFEIVLFNFQVFGVNFQTVLSISNIFHFWSEIIHYIISILYISWKVCYGHICIFILMNVNCSAEKNVYAALLGKMLYKYKLGQVGW